MAEIEIERRPRRTGWTWFALFLVLAAVAVGAWLVFGNGVEGGNAVPAAETTVEEPLSEPLTEPGTEPGTEPVPQSAEPAEPVQDEPVQAPGGADREEPIGAL